jgi:phosphate-selective porin OprO/OprP
MTFALGGFWAAGSFSDFGEAADRLSESFGFNITTRVTGLAWYEDQGGKVLHLGLSYSHAFRDKNAEEPNEQFRTRPETRLTDERFVDTGDFITDGGDIIAAECALVSGSSSLQAEFIHYFVHADAVGNPKFWGFYVYGSHFLTGEQRSYDPARGIFARIEGKRNFHPRRGEWGALEAGLRFSYVDLNSGEIRGGRERNITAGLNWYLFPRIRCMFNYIRAVVKDRESPAIDTGSANIFQTRIQIAF